MTTQASITCPVCRRTSYNPNDIREGYCGYCHDWTSRALAVVAPMAMEQVDGEVEWSWRSPSSYWKVTRVQPAHMTGRQRRDQFMLLLIEFTHHKENGDRLVVETYVAKREEMARLKPFLDAAVELPDGIRLTVHTAKKAPWDAQTPRYRP